MGTSGAYRLYLIYSGATAFFFALVYTVMTVYRVQEAHLNPLQLVLVGTTLEVTYFLFNVPTGVVADTYSRRLSVIVGAFLFGIGITFEGLMPVFWAILVAQVIEGLAYTFVEGALEAWLADEIGEENLGPAFLRAGQVGSATGFVGIWVSVGLASLSVALPIVIGGVLFAVLGAYLVIAMREPGFVRPPREERLGARARVAGSLSEMRGTVRTGAGVVRRRPLALSLLAVAAILGGFGEGWDRLGEAHFLQTLSLPELGGLDPVVWFGILASGSSLLGIGVSEVARRRLDLERPDAAVRALFGIEAVLIAGVLVFALAGNFALAVGAYWVVSACRGVAGPVYGAWLNQGVDGRVRATVISMSGQADALGQFTVGPALGTLGTAYGLRVALTAAGLALSPALLLFGRALGWVGAADRQPEDDSVELAVER